MNTTNNKNKSYYTHQPLSQNFAKSHQKTHHSELNLHYTQKIRTIIQSKQSRKTIAQKNETCLSKTGTEQQKLVSF
jgi:hypothetical protein